MFGPECLLLTLRLADLLHVATLATVMKHNILVNPTSGHSVSPDTTPKTGGYHSGSALHWRRARGTRLMYLLRDQTAS